MKVRVLTGKHSRVENGSLVRYTAGMEFDASEDEAKNFADRLEVIPDEPKPEILEDGAVVEKEQPVEVSDAKPAEDEAQDPGEVGGDAVVETPTEVESDAKPTTVTKRSSGKGKGK